LPIWQQWADQLATLVRIAGGDSSKLPALLLECEAETGLTFPSTCVVRARQIAAVGAPGLVDVFPMLKHQNQSK